MRSREKSMQYCLNSQTACKTMFLNTLGDTEKTLRTALKKSADGFNTIPDMRGKHANKAFDAETINAIKNHIKSFPVIESHYVREGTKRQYLSPELNVAIMYRLYLENKPKVTVGLQTYRNIFNRYFNLGFHKPKKDKCEVCNDIENAPPNQLKRLKEKYRDHRVNKKMAWELKNQCKEHAAEFSQKNKCYAVDMQKILTVPYGEHSLFYYMRNFNVYNLTVMDLVSKQGFC